MLRRLPVVIREFEKTAADESIRLHRPWHFPHGCQRSPRLPVHGVEEALHGIVGFVQAVTITPTRITSESSIAA
jgi:hypothetical protein